jgi:hypothetical protein
MPRIQAYRLLVAAAALSLLAACGQGKTTTVGEFLHTPVLLQDARVFCMASPGERSQLPNCVNSNQALAYQMESSRLARCYTNNSIDHACIDEFLEKVSK